MSRWQITDNGITWKVDGPHADHIEMSGRQISAILNYRVDCRGRLRLRRKLVWPMLRRLPEKTEASLIKKFRAEPLIRLNGKRIRPRTTSITIDGTLTIEAEADGLVITRTILPALHQPVLIENWTITSQQEAVIEIIAPRCQDRLTWKMRSKYGPYRLGVRLLGGGKYQLNSGQSLSCSLIIFGHRASEKFDYHIDCREAEQQRRNYVASLSSKLVLKTPNPEFDEMFRLAKLRAAESIFATKNGLMHGPGGGNYYAAIWANDQAEYVNPLFPWLGDSDANESAINCFRLFARHMNPDYNPIPSSIIAEGDGYWNGAGDRGDQAMIAYGAARFALAYGDRATAKELWPLIEWCLEYSRRQTNADGVIASDSDELENRFPSGDANLCTSCLHYDALISAAYLAGELGKEVKYLDEAAKLREAIENFFGAEVEGFQTYRYYKGNKNLRAWICIPLTVGIFNRRDETLRALFSEKLWTKDGLATQAGKRTFWDRSTLYGLRGALSAGETETTLEYLEAYSRRRLLGEHVPYAVEAWPEGGQRHLAAESGLYCRVFTEGLFGIRPTGLRSFEIKPQLPAGWERMSLEQIRAFGDEFSIKIERSGSQLSATILGGETQTHLFESGETIEIII